MVGHGDGDRWDRDGVGMWMDVMELGQMRWGK